MKLLLPIRLLVVILIFLAKMAGIALESNSGQPDPLPSWNEGPAKQHVINFIESVTNPSSKQYVPPALRIAALDLDGTLLCELPVNFQRSIAIKRLKEIAQDNPELKGMQPYKAAWEGDHHFYNMKENHNFVFLKAFKDYPYADYENYVRQYITSHQAEYWGKPFQNLFYEAGVELVRYLESKGFEVYICSTTEEGCIRVLLNEQLGLPPVRIIGNEVELKYHEDEAGMKLFMVDDFHKPENRNEGKCYYLIQHIGKQPIFSFGNTMGDYAMLKYTDSTALPHFVMVLDHDDKERELEYHDEKLIKKAEELGWEIVSMQRDFRRVFGFEGEGKN